MQISLKIEIYNHSKDFINIILLILLSSKNLGRAFDSQVVISAVAGLPLSGTP